MNPRDFFNGKRGHWLENEMTSGVGLGWVGAGVCLVLPACWGGGGAGCRHKTSAPPPELG